MLRSGEIDIVTIATPSGHHMEPAVEAARYGKHVICEKPPEISLERIDKMIDAHGDGKLDIILGHGFVGNKAMDDKKPLFIVLKNRFLWAHTKAITFSLFIHLIQ